MHLRIRQALPADAAGVLALLERLYAETTFLLYEPGEMNVSVETYAKRMADGVEKQNWVMFIAEDGDELIGVAFGSRGHAKRTVHSFMFGLGVLKAHWRRGIGEGLIANVEAWAGEHNIHRIELTVRTTNTRALSLYDRLGFERGGLKRHSQRVDGHYVDEYLMSKLIGHGDAA